jgi:hypothetical protein
MKHTWGWNNSFKSGNSVELKKRKNSNTHEKKCPFVAYWILFLARTTQDGNTMMRFSVTMWSRRRRRRREEKWV